MSMLAVMFERETLRVKVTDWCKSVMCLVRAKTLSCENAKHALGLTMSDINTNNIRAVNR